MITTQEMPSRKTPVRPRLLSRTCPQHRLRQIQALHLSNIYTLDPGVSVVHQVDRLALLDADHEVPVTCLTVINVIHLEAVFRIRKIAKLLQEFSQVTTQKAICYSKF